MAESYELCGGSPVVQALLNILGVKLWNAHMKLGAGAFDNCRNEGGTRNVKTFSQT